MKTKLRELSLCVKSVSSDGTFRGLLSPYGNVDQGGDLVEPGAFAKSIAEYGNTIPMLWQHKMDCPIGQLVLSDEADGLYCDGMILLDIPEGQKAYSILKAQIIKGLSIGYETIKAQTINGVRHLKELRLYEGSVVTFPMNQAALVSSVKAKEVKGDFQAELADNQVSDQQEQMMSALGNALNPLPWSGLSRDEIVTAAETILQQFSEAYLAYLPVYLDYLSREYGMDTKSWTEKRELKEGRKISASTRDTLTAAHEHVKSAFEALDGLLAEDDSADCDPDDPDSACDIEESEEYKSHTVYLQNMIDLLR